MFIAFEDFLEFSYQFSIFNSNFYNFVQKQNYFYSLNNKNYRDFIKYEEKILKESILMMVHWFVINEPILIKGFSFTSLDFELMKNSKLFNNEKFFQFFIILIEIIIIF